jgi:hypothetical protein
MRLVHHQERFTAATWQSYYKAFLAVDQVYELSPCCASFARTGNGPQW